MTNETNGSAHPPFERLSDLADGALAGAAREAVERHLAACAACRADADALRRVLAAAGAAPRAVEPPPEVWAGVRARVATARAARAAHVRRTWWRRPATLGAAAGLLAAASLTLLVLRDLPPAAPDGSPRSMDPERAAIIAFAEKTLADPAYRPTHHEPHPEILGSERLAAIVYVVLGRRGDTGEWRVTRRPDAPEGQWVACDPYRACVEVVLPAARHARTADGAARELTSDLAVAAGGPDSLPLAARASLDRNLKIVESAIAEARAALASDPGNVAVADALGAAQERRVELLLQATRILTDE